MREPVWIEARDAALLHERVLALHGGASGVRDEGLLLSALARPQQHFAYDEHADVVVLASLYTHGIVKNHPFVDGNKRTGFVVGILFLELNGFVFDAAEEDAANMVIAIASSELDAQAYERFLRDNSHVEQ